MVLQTDPQKVAAKRSESAKRNPGRPKQTATLSSSPGHKSEWAEKAYQSGAKERQNLQAVIKHRRARNSRIIKEAENEYRKFEGIGGEILSHISTQDSVIKSVLKTAQANNLVLDQVEKLTAKGNAFAKVAAENVAKSNYGEASKNYSLAMREHANAKRTLMKGLKNTSEQLEDIAVRTTPSDFHNFLQDMNSGMNAGYQTLVGATSNMMTAVDEKGLETISRELGSSVEKQVTELHQKAVSVTTDALEDIEKRGIVGASSELGKEVSENLSKEYDSLSKQAVDYAQKVQSEGFFKATDGKKVGEQLFYTTLGAGALRVGQFAKELIKHKLPKSGKGDKSTEKEKANGKVGAKNRGTFKDKVSGTVANVAYATVGWRNMPHALRRHLPVFRGTERQYAFAPGRGYETYFSLGHKGRRRWQNSVGGNDPSRVTVKTTYGKLEDAARTKGRQLKPDVYEDKVAIGSDVEFGELGLKIHGK